MKTASRRRRATALAGISLAAAVGILLSGCTSASSSTDSSRLDDIIKDGTLTVGMDLEYEPQMFLDDNNKPAGYDVDLVTLMAKDLGVKLDIQNQKFEALIPGLVGDKFDLVSVGLVNTPERAKTVWFSSPYVPYKQVLLGNKKYSADTTIADLNQEGKVISVLTGSTAAELAKRSFPKATIEELDQDAALLEVESGRADASVVEEYLARPYVKSHEGSTLILNNDEAFSTQFGAYALPKGDVGWQEWVNNWIAYRTADGTLDAEYAKWITPTFE